MMVNMWRNSQLCECMQPNEGKTDSFNFFFVMSTVFEIIILL